jgi:two-component system cell cycle sensor histidine kinase/response regulator CckA
VTGSAPIRVLFVEDVPEDAELAAWSLRREDLKIESVRVETEDTFVAALKDFRPDIVVSDYSMPEFDGMRALDCLLELEPDIPFVVLTGAMNEETAVACLKAGATDYVLKERMARLPFAVREALERQETLRQKRTAEKTLRFREAQYRLLANNVSDVIWLYDLTADRFVYVSPSVEKLLGYSADEALAFLWGTSFELDGIEDARALLGARLRALHEGEESVRTETLRVVQIRKDGSRVPTEIVSTLVTNGSGKATHLQGVTRDISDRLQFEEALRQSEERFSRAFAGGPAGLLISTIPEGRIIDANEAFTRILEYERKDLLGRTTVELGFWADPAARQAAVEALAADGYIHDLEVVFRTKEGERRDLLISAEPVELRGEKCIISTALDLSDRKRAEAAAMDALALNRAIVNNAPIGVVTFKAQGQCVAANQAAAEIFGVGLEQIKGLNFHTLPGWKTYGMDEVAMEVLASGRTQTMEVQGVSHYGKPFWVRQTFASFQVGGEQHLLVLSDDLTERKRAEAREHESESRFQSLLENAPDGVLVCLGDNITFTNPALVRLLGVSGPEDLIGTEYRRWLAPEYRESAGERGRIMQETGLPSPPREEEYLRADGSRVTVETTAVVARLNGTEAGMVVVRDITERRRAESERGVLEEQLRQAQKMESVGMLAGGVAHDFNNLLMVQKGYCELMKSDSHLDPRLADGLAQIEMCVDRAAALTRQLLAFGRKQPMQAVVLELDTLVDDLRDMLQSLIGEGIILSVKLEPGHAMVKADRVQLEQVLVNLAANARDAMPEGGRLELAVSSVVVDQAGADRHISLAPGGYVVLTAADSGSGMDAETQRRIFEPFFTTKGEGKGTGLGLSTVYGIVQQSGGCIEVDSEPGRGATFTIYLPQVAAAPAAQGERTRETRRGKETLVLVVDDDPILRDLVRLMVDSLGYHSVVAPNPTEAAAMVAEGGLRPDLLLSDVVMPGTSGAALVEDLRKTMPDLKVIFMSGYPDSAIARHRLGESTVFFLQKPFSISELSDKIESVLGSVNTPS